MEKCLLKFQEVMYQEYRQEDERFYETTGRMIFLAYLKPILNGKGFSFLEAQTRGSRRMDVVITYRNEKFVVYREICDSPICPILESLSKCMYRLG